MSKVLLLTVALLALGMFAVSACGDDDEGEKKAAAADCNTYGSDATKCDYSVCALQSVSGDACYDDFTDCYLTACPSGSDVANADVNTLATCSTDYLTCTENSGGSDNGNSTDNGGDDPFGGVNCNNTDTTSCDYMICSYKTAFDNAFGALDCGSMQAYCDGYKGCYGDMVDCFIAACPAGTSAANADVNAVTACGTDVSTCVGNLQM